MPEAFKADELGSVLDVSVLFIGSPSDEVVVFEDKGFGTVTLLSYASDTS